jgi:hypothetical protein
LHEANAILGSLIAPLIQTAKLNDVDPQAWLADVSSGPISIPVRKPTSSDSIMLSGGEQSDLRNWSMPPNRRDRY